MERPECAKTRRVIETNIQWLNGLDVRLDINDEGYWEQTDLLDLMLRNAEQAFADRPKTCEMTCEHEDGDYKCNVCDYVVPVNFFI